MSRVLKHIQQSVVFIDSSSSFDDYNNTIFVVSTSSAASCLPLGAVVTSYETSSRINSTSMTQWHSLFPIGSFYGRVSPENIITDDVQGERDEHCQMQPYIYVFFTFCIVCGDDKFIIKIKFTYSTGNI